MALPTILERIANEQRADVAAARATEPDEALFERALATPSPGGRFSAALSIDETAVIAEIKRASPSRGRIAGIPEPLELADAYATGGAAAVSVLTEPRHFLGSANDLRAVAADGRLPVLRKDFVVDERQIAEARLWGASAVLLIVAIHDSVATLGPLIAAATRFGLDALVEVHDADELDVALAAGARIVGVNHRDLHTFTIDLNRFAELRPRIPSGVLTVAESGIHARSTLVRMADAGADAVLVGEHLARADDPVATLRALRGVA